MTILGVILLSLEIEIKRVLSRGKQRQGESSPTSITPPPCHPSLQRARSHVDSKVLQIKENFAATGETGDLALTEIDTGI